MEVCFVKWLAFCGAVVSVWWFMQLVCNKCWLTERSSNTCWMCFWKGSGSPDYFSSFPDETGKNFDLFIRFLICAEWNLNSLCLTEAPKILQKLSAAFKTQHSRLSADDSDRRPVRTHRGATVLHFTNHCAIFYRCRENIYCDVCMNMKLLAVLCLVEGWLNNESFPHKPSIQIL